MTALAALRTVTRLAMKYKGAGKTRSPRYCYSVWLRHLCLARHIGLSSQPSAVAELGPGGSLGIGFAALLSGASTYYALDVLPHADRARDATVFDQLVALFKQRERIPDDQEFPDVKPYLDSYDFPHHILTDKRVEGALREDRLEQIRQALESSDNNTDAAIRIWYRAPWDGADCLEEQSVDMIVSQAVLEHVDDLESTYAALYHWLKPGGFMSHQIDFRSHGTARGWNGHWAYSDRAWRAIRSAWPYLLNREPRSIHVSIMRELGLKIVCDRPVKRDSAVDRQRLAPRFKDLSDEDLCTSGAFIQALRVG